MDGGWQVGWQWVSEPDQTWSATAYLRLIHLGLLGVRYEPDGLWFAPDLPDGWGPVRLSGLDYRNMALDITLAGAGRRVTALTVDGRPGNLISADLTGRHEVRIELVQTKIVQACRLEIRRPGPAARPEDGPCRGSVRQGGRPRQRAA